MHLNLGESYEKFIQSVIEAGLYRNATEVIHDALRHLMEDHEKRRITHIHAMLAVGEEQIARGETVRYTPDLMKMLTEEAIQNAKEGKPIPNEVKPRD